MPCRSMGEITQLRDCLLLRNHDLVREDLWIRDGKIVNAEPLFFVENQTADIQIDCQGSIISPGFIDVQINGGFGVDFSAYTSADLEENVKKVARGILAHGVTSFCPTIVTSPPDLYRQAIPILQPKNGGKDGAGILGLHLEGPFINKEKRGAHPPDLIRSFNNGIADMLEVYGTLESISMLTMAPELPHALSVIRELTDRGITVSLGHSMGSLVDGENAVQNGARFITHLFNAMLPFHHRDPGLVGLLASDFLPSDKPIFYGIIADGIHTHPAALRIAHRTHPNGLVLVTDAISAMGLGPGKHPLGQQVIDITGNRAVIDGTQTLCGSIATMNVCIKKFMKATGCTSVEALECATLHPAQALGITQRKGTLNFDSDADFVILDSNLNVTSTYISGECVWEKNSL